MINKIQEWAKERQLHKSKFDPKVETINVLEELLESFYLSGLDPRDVAKKVYEYMLTFGKPKEPTVANYVDRIDAMVYILTGLMKLDINVDCAVKEVYKEISSRRQDSMQKIEWSKRGPYGKWLKDKNQPKETLYKPNFNKCILKDK